MTFMRTIHVVVTVEVGKYGIKTLVGLSLEVFPTEGPGVCSYRLHRYLPSCIYLASWLQFFQRSGEITNIKF